MKATTKHIALLRDGINVLFGALLIAAIVSCSGNDAKSGDAQSQVNTPPALTFTALDPDGVEHKSSEWIGKGPVVINFWGTWCPPCRKEIPDLAKVYHEFQSQGVTLISLAVNDEPDRVKEYAADAGMDWVQLMADKQILIDYKATTGIPTTIFLDKNGQEVHRFVGWQEYDDFKQAFSALVSNSVS